MHLTPKAPRSGQEPAALLLWWLREVNRDAQERADGQAAPAFSVLGLHLNDCIVRALGQHMHDGPEQKTLHEWT